MRNGLFSVLLFACIGLSAQVLNATSTIIVYDATPVIYMDDFELLADQQVIEQEFTNWVLIDGQIKASDDGGDIGFRPSSGPLNCAYYDVEIAINHYSQVDFEEKAQFHSPGPAVRVDTDSANYYAWYVRDGDSYLIKVIDGAVAVGDTLAIGDDWDVDDVVKLQIDGFDLSCYRNDVLDTSIDTDGVYTDNDADKLDHGLMGLFAYGNNEGTRGDNWVGGEQ